MPVLNGYKKWDRKIRGKENFSEIIYPLPDRPTLTHLREFVRAYQAGLEADVWTNDLDSAFSWTAYEERVGLPSHFFFTVSKYDDTRVSEAMKDTLNKMVSDWERQLDDLPEGEQLSDTRPSVAQEVYLTTYPTTTFEEVIRREDNNDSVF